MKALRIILGMCLLVSTAVGQTLTTLHNFCSPTNCSDGGLVNAGVIQGKDGNFYGTTFKGAAGYGTVYKITPSGTLTVLHTFTGKADGGNAYAGVIQASDGNLYGTTQLGTIYRVTPTGSFKMLHKFSAGTQVNAGLLQAKDGNFYGATATLDTVFKMTPAGVVTTLHTFKGPDGANPLGTLIQASDGNFYGTTQYGGTSSNCAGGCGTVYKITPAGVFTSIASFSFANGSVLWAGLVEGSDGNFYVTTSLGENGGTVCKITPAGVITVLASPIDSYSTLLEASDGDFFGTAVYGVGQDGGLVFEMSPKGAISILYGFNGPDGLFPFAGLTRGTDGNLYGTTSAGGAYWLEKTQCTNGCGTVFVLAGAS